MPVPNAPTKAKQPARNFRVSSPPTLETIMEENPEFMYSKDRNGNKYVIKVPFDLVLEENCTVPKCNCGKNHINPSNYTPILKKGTPLPANMCWNEQPKIGKRCHNSECCETDVKKLPRLHLKNHHNFVVKERAKQASIPACKDEVGQYTDSEDESDESD